MNLSKNKLNEYSNKNGNFNFVNILTLIFVIAKLTGHFNYSWWVVFSPMWVTALIIIAVVIIFIIAAIITKIF